ncbi:MarR family winged helix-turn-helix transcriptional regulator [Fictibacillus sp. S7]|uniref:MarR family winged helix-turn-helix transcriptional regulator n=1 Tax=Fictibacillus sp. S7 TaxID=2212476 RepID=UPI0010106ACC|nr:MarR family transcriptional regulator [Fictibacillus sp. S7]RXZ00564.1 MarR family transcriptional regulator [Fictibacillus sp. S7]
MNEQMQKKINELDKINDTFFQLRRAFIEDQMKEFSYSLTATKYSVLKMLFENHKCMVVDISNKMRLTSGATTTLLNQLEDDKLIQRTRDEKDRRVVWIILSEDGKALMETILRKRDHFWMEMLSTLEREEQEEYIRLLKKIEAGIRAKVK